MASKAELKEAVERWQKHCETVQQATVVNTAETARERLARIKRVRADYAAFVEYYFPHYTVNPETGKQMNAGELEVELTPMGTLVEKIRAAGSGLGGFLTPTGVGTPVEEGKQTMEVDGKKYLFEKPLKADFALIYGTKADKFGNVYLEGTTRNFNVVMASAADTVIVEADELVDDSLDPNMVTIPGIFVDYIVV